jgi:hypothetical protein
MLDVLLHMLCMLYVFAVEHCGCVLFFVQKLYTAQGQHAAEAVPTGRYGCCNQHVTLNTRHYLSISVLQVKNCNHCWLQVYWAGVHPKFPEGGKMTQHLAAMKVGAAAAAATLAAAAASAQAELAPHLRCMAVQCRYAYAYSDSG